jgi:excisionase family DNA binding protein
MSAAATYLGITDGALRMRVHRRTIPFIRDGHGLRFDKYELDAHMRAHRISSTQVEDTADDNKEDE